MATSEQGDHATKVVLKNDYDYLAPDGSEIRLLVRGTHGSLAHCVLPAGRTTHAVRHQTVEELWYVAAGSGRIWRSFEAGDRIDGLCAGDSIQIPVGVGFQFQAADDGDLELLLTTIPPWPGASEAVPIEGTWPASAKSSPAR